MTYVVNCITPSTGFGRRQEDPLPPLTVEGIQVERTNEFYQGQPYAPQYRAAYPDGQTATFYVWPAPHDSLSDAQVDRYAAVFAEHIYLNPRIFCRGD